MHFLTSCSLTEANRASYYSILNSLSNNFQHLPDDLKTNFILCPTSATTAKLANRYISLLFQTRTQVDEGKPINDIDIINYNAPTDIVIWQ